MHVHSKWGLTPNMYWHMVWNVITAVRDVLVQAVWPRGQGSQRLARKPVNDTGSTSLNLQTAHHTALWKPITHQTKVRAYSPATQHNDHETRVPASGSQEV